MHHACFQCRICFKISVPTTHVKNLLKLYYRHHDIYLVRDWMFIPPNWSYATRSKWKSNETMFEQLNSYMNRYPLVQPFPIRQLGFIFAMHQICYIFGHPHNLCSVLSLPSLFSLLQFSRPAPPLPPSPSSSHPPPPSPPTASCPSPIRGHKCYLSDPHLASGSAVPLSLSLAVSREVVWCQCRSAQRPLTVGPIERLVRSISCLGKLTVMEWALQFCGNFSLFDCLGEHRGLDREVLDDK